MEGGMMEIIKCTQIPVPKKGQSLYYVTEELIGLYPRVYKVTLPCLTCKNHVDYYIIKEAE
jgi:hypothetical protein